MMTPKEVQRALKRITTLAESRRHALEEIDGIVATLRSPNMDGYVAATWDEIGQALGVSKQAVQARHRALSWVYVEHLER